MTNADADPTATGLFDRPQTTVATRWVVLVVSAAYIAYLALLVTCDLRRVAPLGFVPPFEGDVVRIGTPEPGSAGARISTPHNRSRWRSTAPRVAPSFA